MTETYTTMTVKQLRKMKPRRFVLLGVTHQDSTEYFKDYDVVFADNYCYKIHRVSGETTIFDTQLLGKDWSKEVEGLPEDKEIQVPLHVYKNYLEQEKLI